MNPRYFQDRPAAGWARRIRAASALAAVSAIAVLGAAAETETLPATLDLAEVAEVAEVAPAVAADSAIAGSADSLVVSSDSVAVPVEADSAQASPVPGWAASPNVPAAKVAEAAAAALGPAPIVPMEPGPESGSARDRTSAAERDTAALEMPVRRVAAARRAEGSMEVKSDFIRRIPSTMNDPVRAMAFTPGVSVQNDVNVRPYVRGGEAEQTRVVMDGLPLLQPYHVGGVFSMFNLNTLDGVELYRDDFPVEYPGALSGVLRLKSNSRIPEKTRVNANLSLVRGDAYAEVPVIPGALSVYGAAQIFLFNRALHGILDVSGAASRDSAFQADMQGYRDHINMPDFLDYHWGAHFAPKPALRLDYQSSLSTDAYAVVVPRQSNVIITRINPKFGDPTAPVKPQPPSAYKRDVRSRKLSVDSISDVSIGNQMHFLNAAWDVTEANLVENGFGFQTQEWDVGFKHGAGTASDLSLSQSAQYFNYRLSDTWTASDSHRFKFGAGFDYRKQRYDMNLPYVLYDVIVNGNVDMLEPLGYLADRGFTIPKEDTSRTNFDYLGEYPSRISFIHRGEIEEKFGSVFFSHQWKTASGALDYGVRGEYQSASREFFPAPRLDYRWDVDARNALKFTTGLYSQDNLPFYQRDRNLSLKSEKSGQLGMQWTHRFSKGYRATVDGYYKRYYDLVTASLAPDNTIDMKGFFLPLPGSPLSEAQIADLRSILDTATQFQSLPDSVRDAAYQTFGGMIFQYANSGTGNSYGTEFSFFYEPTVLWNGWISADFSLSERSDGEGRPYYAYRYHRPVVLNWVNFFDIPGGFDISLTYRWAMGQPYTPYSGGMDGTGSLEPIRVGARNSGRLSPYSRLDLRLTRNARWWNRDFKAYLEVWNSMNSPNYFARDNSTGELKSAQLNWPFPLFFLGVSGDL